MQGLTSNVCFFKSMQLKHSVLHTQIEEICGTHVVNMWQKQKSGAREADEV